MNSSADGGLAAMLVSQAQGHMHDGRNEAALLLALRAQECLAEQPDFRAGDALADLYISLGNPERALDVLEGLPSTSARRRDVRTASFAAALNPGAVQNKSGEIAKRLLRMPVFRTAEIQEAATQTGAIFDSIDDANALSSVDYAKSYTICMTPRSGSTFLTKLLGQAGVFGHPQEYLHRLEDSALPAHARRFGAGSWQTYLAALAQNTCSPNGVFGVKADPSMLLPLLVDGSFVTTLARGRFIYITRQDLLGQAISFTRAQYSGAWTADVAARSVPQFDFQAIHSNIAHLAKMMSRWEILFAMNAITPLRLSYEQIDADPKSALTQIADFLNVDMPQVKIPEANRQRDDISAAWRTQFLALLT
jgi:LPS sulfotransferase NodH